MARQAHNPSARWRQCSQCDARMYFSRKDAKTVRGRHQNRTGLTVYPCPHAVGGYHIGRRPAELSHGEIGRDTLRRNQLSTAADLCTAPGRSYIVGEAVVPQTLEGNTFEEYTLRCLPAGARFRIPEVDVHGCAIDPIFVGRTGIVVASQPTPITSHDGELREVIHAVRYDDDTTIFTLSDLRMTVAASAAR